MARSRDLGRDQNVINRLGSALRNAPRRWKSVASNAAVLRASSSLAARWRGSGFRVARISFAPLSPCSPRRFQPDARAAADHDHSLPEEVRFAL